MMIGYLHIDFISIQYCFMVASLPGSIEYLSLSLSLSLYIYACCMCMYVYKSKSILIRAIPYCITTPYMDLTLYKTVGSWVDTGRYTDI